MIPENIEEAEKEAIRFLKRIREVKESQINKHIFKKANNYYKVTTASKETGALKRSSLDLSRALSKMRNDIW